VCRQHLRQEDGIKSSMGIRKEPCVGGGSPVIPRSSASNHELEILSTGRQLGVANMAPYAICSEFDFGDS
jgi:hypothetical protein